MTEENKSVKNFPNLRFPGFEGQWSKTTLESLGNIITGSTPATHETTFYNGNRLFVSPADLQSNRYVFKTKTTLTEKGFNKGRKIRRGSTYFVCIGSTIGKVGQATEDSITNQQINSVIPFDNDDDFVFSLLEYSSFRIKSLSAEQAVPIINKTTFSNIIVAIPNIEEQKKISSLFKLLDERIQTQKKIIEDLQVTKKEISFKLFKEGFNSSESKKENLQKLGDLTYIVNKKNKENLKLPVYSINNKKGFISQSEQFEGIDSDERGYDISLYKIIEKETFAYNPARINVGSIGYSRNLENIIISSLYVCFKTIDEVDDEFLFQYLRTDIFRKEVLRNVEGGVRDYLFYENFSRIKINLPDLKEQIKINKLLFKFDEKITLENELLTQYENQKKYLLQNLFV
ncbi:MULTISPECIES: restriction endonuclease subunit S [unclassified Chryseobacterium]|uniref:restriction endonuclease subunit S n=1 Tax=unclassified Chryseobacterium TaxID=2593645 RepID=UPI0030101112